MKAINFIKRFSVLKLTGLKNFICVEILPGKARLLFIKRAEAFYNILSDAFNEKQYSIRSESEIEFNGIYSNLYDSVIELIKINKVDNPQIIFCINEYMLKPLAVPHDTEDVDLWFIENIENIVPDGYSKNEVAYNYEQTSEDENYKYYNVLIAESSCVNEIISSFAKPEYSLLAIMPLPKTGEVNNYSSILSVIKKLTENIDTRLNLLDNESFEKQRTLLDKKISLNFILLMGFLVLLLQLMSMAMNYYTTSKSAAGQEAQFYAEKQLSLNNEIRQRNLKMKKDVSLLTSLKSDRLSTSHLLYEISGVLPAKSSLTSLYLKEVSNREIYIEVQGLAESQSDVALTIQGMEKSVWFKNTALLFSSAFSSGEDERTKNLIQFKISAKYNAYKK